MIEIPIGRSIMVVEVFIIHMLKIKLAIMKPAINLSLLNPVMDKTNKAILLCKFHFCIAIAIMNPPANKN